ncbi:MAG: TonB-dependent receptor [Alphaproteobacteria bacterium]|jgi:iron complex outermembrane receptor protein|nr:TonB-dependent receptor [Alphaproteobacteria bacterium]
MIRNKRGQFSLLKALMACASIAGLTASFGGAPAFGQTAADAGASSGGIETVTVTAEKRAQNIQSVGMSISAFSGDMLEQNNITSVADLATYVPGLQITQANNNRNSQIIIRNVGTSGTSPGTEPDVGVFLDGVFIPVAGPIYSEVTDIATVEVLRGPQGTLYGRNTPVGAVNVTTRAPSQQTEGMINLQFGNYGKVRTSGYFGGGISDDVAGRVSFWVDRNSGYLLNLYNNERVMQRDQFGGRARIRWTPDADTTVDVIGYYGRIDAENNSGMQLDPLGPGGIVFGYNPAPASFDTSPFVIAQKAANPAHPYVVPGKWEVNSANGAPDITTTWGASVSVSRNVPTLDATLINILAFNSYVDNALDQGAGSLPLNIISNMQRTLVSSASNELRLVSNGSHFIDYVAGLYLFHDDLAYHTLRTIGEGATRKFPASIGGGGMMNIGDTSTVDYRQHTNSVAGYGQVTVNITDALRAIGGLRYSYDAKGSAIAGTITNIAGNTVSGPAAAQYAPGSLAGTISSNSWTYMYGGQYDILKDVMGYFTISTGFKDGGFNSRSATATPYAFDPETSTNYEIGAKTAWFDNRLVLNFDFYHMLVHGYQQSTLLPSGVGFVISNAGNFRTNGVEAEFQARPFEQLTLSGGLSYADSIITDGAERGQCDKSYPFAGSNPPPSSGPYTDATKAYCNYNGKVLPLAPKWQWNIGARYEQHWQQSPLNWFVQAGVSGVSGQHLSALLDPRDWQESYALFNASVGIEPDSGVWRVSLWGKNLGDKKYFVAAAPQTVAANVSAGGTKAINGYVGWPGIPRTFGVEASYRF